MISSLWTNQDLGRRVDAFFSDRQCVVWRDEHNMQGNIVDAMMKGVLESEFFVCLVSRAYFNSANCRTEFEFAKKNKRKIVPINVELDFRDTWLGFHLGDALYYTIVPDFDGPMAQLFAKEIGGAALECRASRRMPARRPRPLPPRRRRRRPPRTQCSRGSTRQTSRTCFPCWSARVSGRSALSSCVA